MIHKNHQLYRIHRAKNALRIGFLAFSEGVFKFLYGSSVCFSNRRLSGQTVTFTEALSFHLWRSIQHCLKAHIAAQEQNLCAIFPQTQLSWLATRNHIVLFSDAPHLSHRQRFSVKIIS